MLCWTFGLASFNLVSVALPVLSLMLGATSVSVAYSGFANRTFFLLLGIYAVVAALSSTGLIFRASLWLIRKAPLSYLGQTLTLAVTGLLLTPLLLSGNARVALVSPLALDLSEALRLPNRSPGAVGLSMTVFIFFGQMSFATLNGSFTNLLVIGLLPTDIAASLTFNSWAMIALPLVIVFFILMYVAIFYLYRSKNKQTINVAILDAQVATLGPLTRQEKTLLIIVVALITGILSENIHGVDSAIVAMLTFIFLGVTKVLSEKNIRTDIDWNFLIAFASLVSFGQIINTSGLNAVFVDYISPILELFRGGGGKLIFLIFTGLLFFVVRLVVPATPALLVNMLALTPFSLKIGINPIVTGIVLLMCLNPWFFPQQCSMFQNLVTGTQGKLIDHKQTIVLSFIYVAVCIVAIMAAYPFWQMMGLIER